tara:strand:- start:82 stop:225 length:144 start_codon:yes stop_codon:yes gene_type:complete
MVFLTFSTVVDRRAIGLLLLSSKKILIQDGVLKTAAYERMELFSRPL